MKGAIRRRQGEKDGGGTSRGVFLGARAPVFLSPDQIPPFSVDQSSSNGSKPRGETFFRHFFLSMKLHVTKHPDSTAEGKASSRADPLVELGPSRGDPLAKSLRR